MKELESSKLSEHNSNITQSYLEKSNNFDKTLGHACLIHNETVSLNPCGMSLVLPVLLQDLLFNMSEIQHSDLESTLLEESIINFKPFCQENFFEGTKEKVRFFMEHPVYDSSLLIWFTNASYQRYLLPIFSRDK